MSSVFVFSFSLFFVSVPCARLSWPSRQLLSARKYTVSYRIISYRRSKQIAAIDIRLATIIGDSVALSVSSELRPASELSGLNDAFIVEVTAVVSARRVRLVVVAAASIAIARIALSFSCAGACPPRCLLDHGLLDQRSRDSTDAVRRKGACRQSVTTRSGPPQSSGLPVGE